MDPIIKCLLLKNDIVLISEIVEVGTELGEPDCKLTNPFKLNIFRALNNAESSKDVLDSRSFILNLILPSKFFNCEALIH